MADEQRTEQGMGEIEDLEAPEGQSDDVRGGADKNPDPPPPPKTLGNLGQAGSLGLGTA